MASVSFQQAKHGEPMRRRSRYGVRAFGLAQKPLTEIAEWRKELGPPGGPPFPAALLKPSDEQTVVAVAAVLKAIEHFGLAGEDFTSWAVVAAPRFLGRLAGAEMIAKFESNKSNASKISPLFVPHRSLHAISGTISQALNITGPNFGVGGGRNAAVEGLLNVLSMLDDHDLPGLWLVLTECNPEPETDLSAVNNVPVVCHALALAFAPVAEDWRGLRLSLEECKDFRHLDAAADSPPAAGALRESPLVHLYQFLDEGRSETRFGTWLWPLQWGHVLRLSDDQ